MEAYNITPAVIFPDLLEIDEPDTLPAAHVEYTTKEGIPLVTVQYAYSLLEGKKLSVNRPIPYLKVPIFVEASFAIQLSSDEMMPKYGKGDYIAIQVLPNNTFFQWNKVYIFYTGQGLLLGRVHEGKNKDTVMIVPDNKTYPPVEVERQQCIAVGKVIGSFTKD